MNKSSRCLMAVVILALNPNLCFAGDDVFNFDPLRDSSIYEAAKNGDIQAQYELGLSYHKLSRNTSVVSTQYGSHRDLDVEAVKWMRKAALKDHKEAQVYLASFYEEGRGVSRNNVAAFQWYARSCGNGSKTGMANLRSLRNILDLDEIYELLNSDIDVEFKQMLSDRSEINVYKMAKNGDVDAMFGIGRWYLRRGSHRGDVFIKSHAVYPGDTKALEWLAKAAELGHGEAGLLAGYMYESGIGCDPDLLAAKRMYEVARKNGIEEASERLKLVK